MISRVNPLRRYRRWAIDRYPGEEGTWLVSRCYGTEVYVVVVDGTLDTAGRSFVRGAMATYMSALFDSEVVARSTISLHDPALSRLH